MESDTKNLSAFFGNERQGTGRAFIGHDAGRARGEKYRPLVPAVSAIMCLIFVFMSCLAAGCAKPTVEPLKYTKEELNTELRKLKLAYYDASIIVEAHCRRSGVYGGVPRSDFVIESVFAGRASKGQAITCEYFAAPGSHMLLYLDLIDRNGKYAVVDNCAFMVETETETEGTEGQRFVLLTETVTPPLELISASIERQNTELRVPVYFMHYNNITSLVNHCDTVVLGRIERINEYEAMDCRSLANGEMTKRRLHAAMLSVIVEDGFGSGYKKDDRLAVELIEEAASFVISSDNLEPIAAKAMPVLTEDNYYIMFLNKNEDKKRDSFFSVNPYQGFVEAHPENGKVIVRDNNAMFGIDTIREFKDKLEKIRNYGAAVER